MEPVSYTHLDVYKRQPRKYRHEWYRRMRRGRWAMSRLVERRGRRTVVEQSGFGVAFRPIQPNGYTDANRCQHLSEPKEKEEFPEEPAHGFLLLDDQLVTLADHRLNTGSAIGQIAELVADTAHMNIDAPIEALQWPAQPLSLIHI